MFVIRDATMQAFRRAALATVRPKLVAAVRETLPDETARLTPTGLDQLCDRVVLRADRYGLHSEHGAYVFLAAALVYGEGFDASEQTAWARDILPDPKMDPAVKAK